MRVNQFIFVHENQIKLALNSHLKEYTNTYACRCLQMVKIVGKLSLK